MNVQLISSLTYSSCSSYRVSKVYRRRQVRTYLEDVSVELLLQLLIGPIDTELLKRILFEMLETVLDREPMSVKTR